VRVGEIPPSLGVGAISFKRLGELISRLTVLLLAEQRKPLIVERTGRLSVPPRRAGQQLDGGNGPLDTCSPFGDYGIGDAVHGLNGFLCGNRRKAGRPGRS
jgi:hypothetical protein